MSLKYMDLEDFVELCDYIDEHHSFRELKGRMVKYITPVFDTRINKVFSINLRRAGKGKTFSLTNKNKDRDLKLWIYDWLENGSWEEESRESTRLNWRSVGKDYVAKYNNFIFVLKKGDIGVIGRNGKAYRLQARSEEDLSYKNIGYCFVTNSDGTPEVKDYSVDNKIWSSVNLILSKSEDILRANFYID